MLTKPKTKNNNSKKKTTTKKNTAARVKHPYQSQQPKKYKKTGTEKSLRVHAGSAPSFSCYC